MDNQKLDDLLKETNSIADYLRMLLSQNRISEQLYITKISRFLSVLDEYNKR
jgi:hypothetical protein